jgi:integrase
MASVYEKAGKWYLRFKDSSGRWRDRVSKARTKTEARRLADELDRQAERQRFGIDERPAEDGGGTVAQLMEWWLATYSEGMPTHERNGYSVRKHITSSELARVRLASLTPGMIETFLKGKESELGPASVNHLRRYLLTAFNCAKRAGRYTGKNPALEVQVRKVPRRVPDFLRHEEVPAVLGALRPQWRPLFATAIYTGLRKGELFGLRKGDVDVRNRLLTVARSWGRDTTKGAHADVIPIAAELVPYLEEAISSSPSELVFPGKDGGMRRRHVDLPAVLRGALARAGIVTGYSHACRSKGCGHSEEARDATPRSCPACGKGLWAKPRVRRIRFHDARHTTASLLMMKGANPAAVQRVMRHSDPRITTEVYGHLAPDYLRAEVDRLTFGLPVESEPQQTSRAAGAVAMGAPKADPFAASLLQAPANTNGEPGSKGEIPQSFQAVTMAQNSDSEVTPALSRRERVPRGSVLDAAHLRGLPLEEGAGAPRLQAVHALADVDAHAQRG